MKRNPGSLWILLLALPIWLFAASDFRYTMTLSRDTLYLKEPLLLKFTVWQTDPNKVMFFDFKPLDEGKFFVKRLDKAGEERQNLRKATFTYLLYPLQSGTLPLRFDLLVKRTNEERIALSTTGGRDNVKDVETTDTHESVEPAILHVKPLPEKVDLVGDFTLQAKTDTQKSEAYRPLYLTMRLKGRGFPPEASRLEPRFPAGVEHFADNPHITLKYTLEGILFDGLWSYALVASKTFTVPPISLKAFSPQKERIYTLTHPPLHIEIYQPPVSKLTAPRDTPESAYAWIERVKSLSIYLFIFLCGYVSALLWVRIRNRTVKASVGGQFARKVSQINDPKELLGLLIHEDVHRYGPWIEELERAIYGHENVNLKKIKREVLKNG